MSDVMTVLGPIPADSLGTTLPHEHVFINLMNEYKKEGVLNDPRLAESELRNYVGIGGRTVVDLTSLELGRDPRALKKVALATGLNIVMGSGHYRDPYIDRESMDRIGVAGLTAALIDDIQNGFENSGIRPGIIGEVGSNRAWISSAEERALRVAAKAHLATGLTIMTHAARWPLGEAQLDVLSEVGVDPRCVIVGHCDMVPSMEYHETIAARGAFVEFDTIRGEQEYMTRRQVEYVMNMARKGYLEQVLISHDVCLTSLYTVYGGTGYTFVTGAFIELLRAAGLSDDDVNTLIVHNPARALTAATRLS
ncbi:MAG: phosphotriesterase family protein [Candidatus Limnocylindrales bacterium]